MATAAAAGQSCPRTVLALEATNPNTSYFREVNKAFNAAIAAGSANSVYVYVESLAFRDFEGIHILSCCATSCGRNIGTSRSA